MKPLLYKELWQIAQSSFVFARHGCALTGASPEHAQVVGNV